MRKFLLVIEGLLIATLAVGVSASAKKAPTPTAADLVGPWQSTSASLILDPFHQNQYTIADLKLDPRIVAIIHKATEGGTVTDKLYDSRKAEALASGYLWGSYHIGRPGDPVGQAQRYFDKVRPSPSEVIALDLEKDGGAMTMSEAAKFIRKLHQLTGRYPLLYGGRVTVGRPIAAADVEVFRHCPLWIVDTRDTPRGWPASLWPKYTLWQFSSELRFRYPLRSFDNRHPVSWDTDVNFYAGDRAALRAAWPFT